MNDSGSREVNDVMDKYDVMDKWNPWLAVYMFNVTKSAKYYRDQTWFSMH